MNLKLFKKLICCVLIVLSIFVFSGCADVNYSTVKNSDGSITETVNAQIDFETLQSEGYNIINKKHEINSSVIRTLNQYYNNYLTNIRAKILEYKLANDDEMSALYEQLLTAVKIENPIWNENIYNVKISFSNSSAYYIFYNITTENFNETRTEDSLFIKKTYFVGHLGYFLNNGLYSILKSELSAIFPTHSSNDVQLSYSYFTQARRYHSNANNIMKTDTGYLHTWNVAEENLDKEIYFYVISAHRDVWLLSAIVLSIILLIILLIISKIINYKKHKKKT